MLLLLPPTDRPTVRSTNYDSPITGSRALYDKPIAACRSYDPPMAVLAQARSKQEGMQHHVNHLALICLVPFDV